MKHLFIGGVADGQRIEVSNPRQPQQAREPTNFAAEMLTDTKVLGKQKIFRTEYYEPVRLQDGDSTGRVKLYTVFARPCDEHRVVEILIEGYKRNA